MDLQVKKFSQQVLTSITWIKIEDFVESMLSRIFHIWRNILYMLTLALLGKLSEVTR